jgi:16S rRNA (guanine(966)-N(2))-methyltransferase RsmD
VWEGARVLDLFAGTGALGIEALSRGAESVLFVDRAPIVLRCLRANLADLGLEDRSEVMKGDAVSILRRLGRGGLRFDVVLLDPPYDSDALALVLPCLTGGGALGDEATLVVERSRHQALPEVDGLRTLETRRYGDTVIDALRWGPVE